MESQQKFDQEEYNKILRQFRWAGGITLLVLVSGSVFYHFVERLSWLDALYLCIITLTTIGYGDIVPHTSLGKLFTIFYVIVGIGILAAFINLLLKRALYQRHRR